MDGPLGRRRGLRAPIDEQRRPRALAVLGAAALVCVAALAGATAALGDVSATSSGDGLVLTATSAGPVVAGVAADYTFTVTNTNAVAIPTVNVDFQPPPGMSLQAAPASCVKNLFGGPSPALAQCSLGALAPGAVGAVTVGLVAATPGDDTIQPAALGLLPIAGGGDQVLSASVSLTVPVSPGPTDVQVTGSSNNGSPPVGSQFSYTFQVKDNGPQGASAVTFDDFLPATMTLAGASTDLGTCTTTADRVHCDLGDLGVGRQATIVITAVATALGPVTDTASIAMAGPDTHAANDTVSVTVQPR
jgi:uncharacterized repeat protein (TIGR01451 family)